MQQKVTENYWINKLIEKYDSYCFPANSKIYRQDIIEYQVELSEIVSQKLFAVAKESRNALYAIFLAALKVSLYKFSGKEKNRLGIIKPEKGELVFIQDSIDKDITFKEYLFKISKIVKEAFACSEYDLESVLRKLKNAQNIEVQNIFSICAGVSGRENRNQELIKKFKSLILFDFNQTNYRVNVFYENKNQAYNFFPKIADILVHILTDFELCIQKPISKIVEDYQSEIFLAGKITGSFQKSISKFFNEISGSYKDSIALVDNDIHLSYSFLDAITNSLASELIERGIGYNKPAAIILPISKEFIISVLAIVKANGAFLSIHKDTPIKRINFILQDSQTQLVLTDKNFRNELGIEQFYVQEGIEDWSNQNKICFQTKLDNISYIIYTSGTTGIPKGVLIKQIGLLNYITWAKAYYLNNKPANMPLFTSPSVDLTLTSIFVPLMSGGTIYMNEQYSENIINLFSDDRLNLVKLTPSHLKTLVYSKGSKKLNLERKNKPWQLILGGEELEVLLCEQANKILGNDTIYHNEYGPTETVVGSLIYSYSNPDSDYLSVPIGKPINNTRIEIQKDDFNCDIGVPGELLIAGTGVAMGYLNSQELTHEKFINDKNNSILYRTGDLVYRNLLNQIEFLGRIDDQIKIRGHRVEVKEIEYAIFKYSGITQVLVCQRNVGTQKKLIAYVVSEDELLTEDLESFISEHIPYYMMPDEIIRVKDIPLTISGKVNFNALPDVAENKIICAGNYIEMKLIDIWTDLLGLPVESISVEQIFFRLGGNSILVISLIAEISQYFKIDLTVSDVFKFNTIKKLAELILKKDTTSCFSLKKVEKKKYYPLSSAQKRIFLFQELDRKSTLYNMTSAFLIEGKLDVIKLETVFNTIINKHNSLRSSIGYFGGQLAQRIDRISKFEIEIEELGERTIENGFKEFVVPFDLQKPPLIKAKAFYINEYKYYLLIDMHHITSDAVSNSLIIKDFVEFFENKTLKNPTMQYIDYCVWQQKMIKSNYYKKQEGYWKNELSGITQELSAYSKKSSILDDYTANSRLLAIPAAYSEMIKKKVSDGNMTVYIFLLSIISLIIANITYSYDFLIAMPVTGRRYKDFQNVIGLFVNLLPIRIQLNDQLAFDDFLQIIRDKVVNAIENQDYQYDDIVSKFLRIDGSSNELPVRFSFAFEEEQYNFYNEDIKYQVDDTTIKPVLINIDKTNYDILFTGFWDKEKIKIRVDYRTSVYDMNSINHIEVFFNQLIEKIFLNKALTLGELSGLSIQFDSNDNAFSDAEF